MNAQTESFGSSSARLCSDAVSFPVPLYTYSHGPATNLLDRCQTARPSPRRPPQRCILDFLECMMLALRFPLASCQRDALKRAPSSAARTDVVRSALPLLGRLHGQRLVQHLCQRAQRSARDGCSPRAGFICAPRQRLDLCAPRAVGRWRGEALARCRLHGGRGEDRLCRGRGQGRRRTLLLLPPLGLLPCLNNNTVVGVNSMSRGSNHLTHPSSTPRSPPRQCPMLSFVVEEEVGSFRGWGRCGRRGG